MPHASWHCLPAHMKQYALEYEKQVQENCNQCDEPLYSGTVIWLSCFTQFVFCLCDNGLLIHN